MRRLDYATLDPGIRRTVGWLREHDYETCDSGDGVTKGEDGRSIPHVSMIVMPATMAKMALELRTLLLDAGIDVVEMQPDGRGVSIQATYDPANSVAIIDLTGLSDAALPKGLGV